MAYVWYGLASYPTVERRDEARGTLEAFLAAHPEFEVHEMQDIPTDGGPYDLGAVTNIAEVTSEGGTFPGFSWSYRAPGGDDGTINDTDGAMYVDAIAYTSGQMGLGGD